MRKRVFEKALKVLNLVPFVCPQGVVVHTAMRLKRRLLAGKVAPDQIRISGLIFFGIIAVESEFQTPFWMPLSRTWVGTVYATPVYADPVFSRVVVPVARFACKRLLPVLLKEEPKKEELSISAAEQVLKRARAALNRLGVKAELSLRSKCAEGIDLCPEIELLVKNPQTGWGFCINLLLPAEDREEQKLLAAQMFLSGLVVGARRF